MVRPAANLQSAFKAAQKLLTSPKVKIYNSEASDHISPFQHCFTSFQSIPPHSITATNQGTFDAISNGDVKIDVPNGDNSAPIILKDVFYSPEISLTLILVSYLLKDKKSILFKDDYCFIKEKGGKVIGQIPEAASRLYKVEHTCASASAITSQEQVSIPMLQKPLKPANNLHTLTNPDMVQVLQIIDLHSSILSECSKSAKATCKPIAKESKAPFAKSFGDKIDNNAIQHNGITSFSYHFLGHICSIIHSTGFHSIWPENCNSSKMLAYSTLASTVCSFLML
jgi:Pol polyprotein